MAVATSIPRYDKNQKIVIDNKEITLIEHLKELRTNRRITKKKISNIIKQNDYWYSQIERNGKNGDDNRQKTIYKTDLIDIISIVKFGATTIADLKNYHDKSASYIENEIHAIPLSESIRKLEWYQINGMRTEHEQDNLFSSLSSSISRLLEEAYNSLSTRSDKDAFLDCLKEMNSSMKINPVFIIMLAGQHYSNFLYENETEKIFSLIKDIAKLNDDYSLDNMEPVIVKEYFQRLDKIINSYIADSKYIQRKKYEILPFDKILF